MVFYWTDGFSVFLSVREGQFIGDRGLGGDSLLLRIYSRKSELFGTQFVNLGQNFWWKPFFFFRRYMQLYIQEQLIQWSNLSNLWRDIFQLNWPYSGKWKNIRQILFGPQTVFVSNGFGSIDKFIGTERRFGSLERTQQQTEWRVLFDQKYNQPLETLRMIRK